MPRCPSEVIISDRRFPCNTLPPTLDEEVLQMALQGKILGNLITTNRNYEH